jgi:hypothetical protein
MNEYREVFLNKEYLIRGLQDMAALSDSQILTYEKKNYRLWKGFAEAERQVIGQILEWVKSAHPDSRVCKKCNVAIDILWEQNHKGLCSLCIVKEGETEQVSPS